MAETTEGSSGGYLPSITMLTAPFLNQNENVNTNSHNESNRLYINNYHTNDTPNSVNSNVDIAPNSLSFPRLNMPTIITDFRKFEIANPFFTNYQLPSSADENEINVKILVLKRLNGNQPWVESNVAPGMLGKMRKISVHLEPIRRSYILSISIEKVSDNGHDSFLVVSENDKGYSRKTQVVDGCDQISIPIDATPNPIVKTAFLKPCWKGFGPRKGRPKFYVSVRLTNTVTEKTALLHSWQSEVHCHKMESSQRGKIMDLNPITVLLNKVFL